MFSAIYNAPQKLYSMKRSALQTGIPYITPSPYNDIKIHVNQGIYCLRSKIWVLYLLNYPLIHFISYVFCVCIEQSITWRDKAAIQSPLKKRGLGGL